jgi:predicted Ser/Thr protein kinase
MAYPQIVEYNEAVQHPAQAFVDPELKQGSIKENNLGLPVVLSGGFALTYTVTTPRRKYAVRCFHREIPSIEQKYSAISKKLKSINSAYFVNFDFQKPGMKVQRSTFPIVRMDWVEGDPLGVWVGKNLDRPATLEKARAEFLAVSLFLEREGIAHGDIQNDNVMMSNGRVKLIDYDGMFVPELPRGNGSETGHKDFQHPDRSAADYGPKMDRFSFIAVDLSLQAVIEDKTFYKGGDTIVFKANDFADPQNSEIFGRLISNAKLKERVRNFATICDSDIGAVPTLEDFLAGRSIPVVKTPILTSPATKTPPRVVGYIAAFPVVDARDFALASKRVGDRVELIGQIVEVKPGVGARGKGRGRPYVFINFGSWRGSIVKIAIWSEGLDKLKEKPSNTWVGRWVGVTGLMDPPYFSKRYGYTHLSITVEEDGQIQRLDEAQARFRLASIGKSVPVRERPSSEQIGGGMKQSTKAAPISATRRPPTSGSSNRDIVNRYKGGSQPLSTPTGATPTASLHSASKASPPNVASSKGGFWARIARFLNLT